MFTVVVVHVGETRSEAIARAIGPTVLTEILDEWGEDRTHDHKVLVGHASIA